MEVVLTEERKKYIEGIVEDIDYKSRNGYSFEDFARENRIYRIREYDFGPIKDFYSAISLGVSDGYAIIMNELLYQEPRENGIKILGHEIGHIVLDHVPISHITIEEPVTDVTISEDPYQEAEADYFNELWHDKFSGNGWIDLEKIRDFTIDDS